MLCSEMFPLSRSEKDVLNSFNPSLSLPDESLCSAATCLGAADSLIDDAGPVGSGECLLGKGSRSCPNNYGYVGDNPLYPPARKD